KDKLYACPKCPKKYSSLGWMKRHLNTSGHSSTWIIYYNSDTITLLTNRISQLEYKLDNLDLKNVIMTSSDIAIKSTQQKTEKTIPKEKGNYNKIVIENLTIIFKVVKPSEYHNLKPSELMKISLPEEKSIEVKN
ncbi:MAG TPA: hypothetical protein VGB37_06235, partial [Candidatus Lokiarchaeia archaeon]